MADDKIKEKSTDIYLGTVTRSGHKIGNMHTGRNAK